MEQEGLIHRKAIFLGKQAYFFFVNGPMLFLYRNFDKNRRKSNQELLSLMSFQFFKTIKIKNSH